MWCCGVVAIITAQPHSSKAELRFCADLDPSCSVLEIDDGEDLSQWFWLKIRLNAFLSVNHTANKNNSVNSS